MTQLVAGNNLTQEQVKEVKARFVNRYTGDFKPAYISQFEHAKDYKPLFVSDSEWVNAYAFWFINDGSRLCKNHSSCVSMLLYDVEYEPLK